LGCLCQARLRRAPEQVIRYLGRYAHRVAISTASPDAPQKWVNAMDFSGRIDFEHGRMQLQQRLVQDFVFAYARNMNGDTLVGCRNLEITRKGCGF